jgi:hypothetical protein
MIIDETFMWLYVAYKIGKVCGVMAVIFLLSIIPFIAMVGENCGEKNLWYKLGVKGILVAFIGAIVCAPIGVLTPDAEEVKAYAAYAIGKNVTTSDEGKRLFDAAINYLEGKPTEK